MSRTQPTARRDGTGERTARSADRPDDERRTLARARGRSPDDGRPRRDRDPPPEDDYVKDGDGLYHPPSRRGAPRLHSKISFGIIITRINASTNRPEAVLVRGRYSYEYAEFVHGRYSRKNTRAVAALFDAILLTACFNYCIHFIRHLPFLKSRCLGRCTFFCATRSKRHDL